MTTMPAGFRLSARGVVPMCLPLDRPPPQARPRRAIGLLGGSFNPAHEGHLHISLEAIKRLSLDEVWWLVSPQNPLKPRKGMATLEQRTARAREVAAHPRIRVSDIERRYGTTYTVDTLGRLLAMHDADFVWLIGADNLAQFSKWKRWRAIFDRVAIAVFDRSPYSHAALASHAAVAYADRRVGDEAASRLCRLPRPVWIFLRTRPHPASSTALRAGTCWPPTTPETKP